MDPRTVPVFSERLWSEEVGMAEALEPPRPNYGYRFSNGRQFVAPKYDDPPAPATPPAP